MHENVQKFEWKNCRKTFCDLLHSKNCPSQWWFLRNFWTGNKSNGRPITAVKKIRKKRKKKLKTNLHAVLLQMTFFEKIGANLAYIQAENLQNIQNIEFLAKSSWPGVNGLPVITNNFKQRKYLFSIISVNLLDVSRSSSTAATNKIHKSIFCKILQQQC